MRALLWALFVAGLAGLVAGAEKESPKTTEPEAKEQTKPEAKAKGAGPAAILQLGGKVTLELIQVPAGKFLMGSPENEKDRRNDEGPQHEVTMTRPFYLGAYEVTEEQYGMVMKLNPKDYAIRRKEARPFSWNGAQEFCKKLGQLAGGTVRLPTEAEWEYACRAGTTTRFCSGDADSDLDAVGWHREDRGSGKHLVGQKKPNAWGLYDMHGNMWEWCQDWYAEKYEAGAAADPQGPKTGTKRVVRGGSTSDPPAVCRSALRIGLDPVSGRAIYGLRVVMVAPRTPLER